MKGGLPPVRRREGRGSLSPLGRRSAPTGSNLPPLGRRALSEASVAARAGPGAKDGAGPVTTHLRKALGKLKPPNQQVLSDVVTRVLELSEDLRAVRKQLSQHGSQDDMSDLKRRVEKLEEAQEDCNSAWTVLQEKGCPRCCLNASLNNSLKFQDAPDNDEGPLVESGSREVQLGVDNSEPAVFTYCQQEVDRVRTLVEQLKDQWQASEAAAAAERRSRAELDATLATLKAHASADHAELGNLGDEAARASGERQELRSILTSLQEGQVEVIRHLQGALDSQDSHRTQLAQQQRALEAASQDRAALRAIVERVEASQSLVTGKLAYLIHTS